MISVALAGKPNAGKSTFYAAATMADVDVANYPFTTIDPNRGVSYVRTRCPCLDRETRCGAEHCRDGTRYVPIELVDVAGLVPGAHEGRGLGNQFLDALSDADVILHVVDASGATDAEGEPVEPGTHDPVEEVDFVERELDLWLASVVERNWEGVERRSRSPDFDLEEALADVLTGVGASRGELSAALREREYPEDPFAWDEADRRALAETIRRLTKPIVVVANKVDAAPTESLGALLALDRTVVPATAEGELALRRAAEAGAVRYDPGDESFDVTGDLSDAQTEGLDRVRAVMDEHGGTGVARALNAATYDELDQITAYPVQNETRWTDGQGNVLPDALLLARGSSPRDLAYAVHSDIGEGYLHAVDARSGRRIADDYGLDEGDVIRIVSTAN
ncbi:MAG: redox-regulated ATPase YchF [Haloferacaceae archaeon]